MSEHELDLIESKVANRFIKNIEAREVIQEYLKELYSSGWKVTRKERILRPVSGASE